MTIPLIGDLTLFKKKDVYPLEAEATHLVRFLRHYRKEITPVDALEFLSIFAFLGEYCAPDSQTLEKIYRLKIPAGRPKNITPLHRQFFEAILPFTGREFRKPKYSETRGILVERLALVALQYYEGVRGDFSMILLDRGKSYGMTIGTSHEELDLVIYPENLEMAIGECKADGSRFYLEDNRTEWYEKAAERIEEEGLKLPHVFAVCATNSDVMTKHMKKMTLNRRWWLFTISEKKEPWKLDP
jgi:hypothetical protein